VDEQIARLQIGSNILRDFDWLATGEYGVYSSGEDYILPITRKAFLSIITGPPFTLFNIDQPTDFQLQQNCFIYIGGSDKLQTDAHDVMLEYFRNRVSNLTPCYVADGDHMLEGVEGFVADQVISWLEHRENAG
jgi:hypothetical protein